jgi:15-cis-phytoene synthase
VQEYEVSAAATSKIITETFSTSFGSATALFPKTIRQDIYNIYGLVRIADEIVDSYQGNEVEAMLYDLEVETNKALRRKFSSNLVVHAFVSTANKYGITANLTEPFFASMRMDITPQTYDEAAYKTYIYGSAEVVGLMCLRVFCAGDEAKYKQLEQGASALGAAFQKVNFLRDIKDDYETRGRYYFPGGSYKTFDEATKQTILSDIRTDFELAKGAIVLLPSNARRAVITATMYYEALYKKLQNTPATTLQQQRIRVNDLQKVVILLRAKVGLYG